jgi:hypothetical protein
MWIAGDEWAVQKELRQVQHVAVRVLSGRHDTGDHVCQVNVIRHTQQVFSLPDLDIAVQPDPLNHIHISPVPSQFADILFDHTAFAQQSVHGIDVFKRHILGPAVQVRVEGEVMIRQAGRRDRLNDGSPHRSG